MISKLSIIAKNKRMLCGLAAFAVIIVIAALIRHATIDIHRDIIAGDETTYQNAALALDQCHTLIRDPSGEQLKSTCNATFALSPGYPVFLYAVYKIFGNSTAVGIAANFFLWLAVIATIGLMVFELTRKWIPTLLTTTLVTLYPATIYNVDRLLTEPLFLAMLLLGSYFFIRYIRHRSLYELVASAALLFVATHVRAQAVTVIIVACFVLAFDEAASGRQRFNAVLLYLLPGVLIFAPWIARNFSVFHEFIPLTNAGEGPKIWGAVPYYLDMGSTEPGVPLAQVLSANSTPDSTSYWLWRIFGYTNYLFFGVWDERLAHLPWWTQKFLWIHYLFVTGVVAIPTLKKYVSQPIFWFLVLAPLSLYWPGMLYHGLPRYGLPIVLFGAVAVGVLVGALQDYYSRKRGLKR